MKEGKTRDHSRETDKEEVMARPKLCSHLLNQRRHTGDEGPSGAGERHQQRVYVPGSTEGRVIITPGQRSGLTHNFLCVGEI